MAITQDSPTGFVNNLTATQDEKLRELWILLFNSIASVLSAVYDVQLPDGPPSKLFEVLDKIREPTVDAVVGALKEESANEQPTNGDAAEAANKGKENGEENGEQNVEESKEEKSLDKMESLMNDEAKRTIMSEIATRKVSPEHFAAVFAQLRKMGVRDSEIKSMETILSKLTPGEMCFAVLKMIKQEHPDSLLLRFLRARKWDVGKAYAMLTTNILWRREMEVDDDIVPKGELHALEQSRNAKSSAKEKKDGHDFIEQLKTGKSFLHGFDKQGRPVNYVRVKIHKPGAQSEETLERYIVHVIESNRLLLDPPVETAVRSSRG